MRAQVLKKLQLLHRRICTLVSISCKHEAEDTLCFFVCKQPVYQAEVAFCVNVGAFLLELELAEET